MNKIYFYNESGNAGDTNFNHNKYNFNTKPEHRFFVLFGLGIDKNNEEKIINEIQKLQKKILNKNKQTNKEFKFNDILNKKTDKNNFYKILEDNNIGIILDFIKKHFCNFAIDITEVDWYALSDLIDALDFTEENKPTTDFVKSIIYYFYLEYKQDFISILKQFNYPIIEDYKEFYNSLVMLIESKREMHLESIIFKKFINENISNFNKEQFDKNISFNQNKNKYVITHNFFTHYYHLAARNEYSEHFFDKINKFDKPIYMDCFEVEYFICLYINGNCIERNNFYKSKFSKAVKIKEDIWNDFKEEYNISKKNYNKQNNLVKNNDKDKYIYFNVGLNNFRNLIKHMIKKPFKPSINNFLNNIEEVEFIKEIDYATTVLNYHHEQDIKMNFIDSKSHPILSLSDIMARLSNKYYNEFLLNKFQDFYTLSETGKNNFCKLKKILEHKGMKMNQSIPKFTYQKLYLIKNKDKLDFVIKALTR